MIGIPVAVGQHRRWHGLGRSHPAEGKRFVVRVIGNEPGDVQVTGDYTDPGSTAASWFMASRDFVERKSVLDE